MQSKCQSWPGAAVMILDFPGEMQSKCQNWPGAAVMILNFPAEMQSRCSSWLELTVKIYTVIGVEINMPEVIEGNTKIMFSNSFTVAACTCYTLF